MAKGIQTPTIKRPESLQVALEICGTASLIQNNFDQKTIEQMLMKHMGLPVERENKIPAECVERSVIRNVNDKICVPPTAIKKAMLSAAAQIKGTAKTKIRANVFIEGGSIPIAYSRMVPRMDMVRTAGIGGTPDVRFRAMFEDWVAKFIITFTDAVPIQTVLDLLHRAGRVGLGEWRPEKDGSYGTFEISRSIGDAKEITRVRAACRPGLKALTIPDWAMNVELSADILSRISGTSDAGSAVGSSKPKRGKKK